MPSLQDCLSFVRRVRHVRHACAIALCACMLAMPCPAGAEPVRVKDLGKLQGWRDNALVGYGIVTGLAGTGDSPTNRATR